MVGVGEHKAGVQLLTGSDQWHLDIQDVKYAVAYSSLEFSREIWGYKG